MNKVFTGRILAIVMLIAGLCGVLLAPHADAAEPKRRNVVLIVADDLGPDLGCYGNTAIRTPNLDALAARGTRFSHAFATVASCSPSRAVMYTGLYTHTNGQYGLAHAAHNAHTFNDVRSLPRRLKDAGYRTGVIGKLHVIPREVYPFDVQIGGGKNVAKMAEQVGEFASSTPKEQPFFVIVGFTDPHRAGQGFGNQKKGGGDDLPAERYEPANVIVPPFLPDAPAVRADLADYYQAVTRLDRGVGLVTGAIAKAGAVDDTLVIFLSDNGIPFPGAKTTLYDAGVRLPLIVSSPAQSRRGVVNDAMVSWVDVMPTILDWAGVNADALPGKSILNLLGEDHAPADAPREVVFGSHVQHEVTMYYPMRSVRTRKYKYILNLAAGLEFPAAGDLFRSPTWQYVLERRTSPNAMLGGRTLESYLRRPREELYDLEADPNEFKNVAGDPANASVLEELRGKLRDWQTATNDPWLVKYEHE